jgi:hypothetical protein
LLWKERKKRKKQKRKTQEHRVGTNVTVRGLNARSQFAFGRSCDRPTRSRFTWFSLVLEQMLS